MPRLTARAATSPVATVNDYLEVVAARHGVSVSQVRAMANRIIPIEKGKRAGQWQLASEAHDMQEEKLKSWAAVFGELVDLDKRTVYDYAKTWELFHDIPDADRYKHRWSAWQVLSRYWDCAPSWEVFQEWVDNAKEAGATPRVDVLRGMMAARFGNEPTPAASRAKVGRLYKSLEGLQVDFYNTMPDEAKAELSIAFKHVAKAKEIMEVKHG